MWGYHDGIGWWFVFGGIWWIAIVGAVIWLAVWAATRRGERAGGIDESPSEIAKRRLASGEIDMSEFERIEAAVKGRT